MRSSVIQSVKDDLGYDNLMELIHDFVPEVSSVTKKVI